MENLMFKFLDNLNPNFFMYRTKFGIIPRYDRDGYNYVIGDIVRKDTLRLCDYFSCEFEYASSVYKKWMNSKPVHIRIKNSTNGYLFVPENHLTDCVSVATTDLTPSTLP